MIQIVTIPSLCCSTQAITFTPKRQYESYCCFIMFAINIVSVSRESLSCRDIGKEMVKVKAAHKVSSKTDERFFFSRTTITCTVQRYFKWRITYVRTRMSNKWPRQPLIPERITPWSYADCATPHQIKTIFSPESMASPIRSLSLGITFTKYPKTTSKHPLNTLFS